MVFGEARGRNRVILSLFCQNWLVLAGRRDSGGGRKAEGGRRRAEGGRREAGGRCRALFAFRLPLYGLGRGGASLCFSMMTRLPMSLYWTCDMKLWINRTP